MSWFMIGGAAIGAGAGAIVGNNSSSIDQGQAIMMGGMAGMGVGGMVGSAMAPAAAGALAPGAVAPAAPAAGGAMNTASVAAANTAWNAGQASLNTGFMASLANSPTMTASMLGGALNIASAFSSSSGGAPSANVKMPGPHREVLKDLKQSEAADREVVERGGYNNIAAARIGQFSKQLQDQERAYQKSHAVVGTQSSVEGSSTSGKSIMAGLLQTTEAAGAGGRVQGLRNEMAREGFQKNLAMSSNIANIESQTPYLKAQQDIAGQRANIMDQQRRGGAIAGGLDMVGMASYYNTRNRA